MGIDLGDVLDTARDIVKCADAFGFSVVKIPGTEIRGGELGDTARNLTEKYAGSTCANFLYGSGKYVEM